MGGNKICFDPYLAALQNGVGGGDYSSRMEWVNTPPIMMARRFGCVVPHYDPRWTDASRNSAWVLCHLVDIDPAAVREAQEWARVIELLAIYNLRQAS